MVDSRSLYATWATNSSWIGVMLDVSISGLPTDILTNMISLWSTVIWRVQWARGFLLVAGDQVYVYGLETEHIHCHRQCVL